MKQEDIFKIIKIALKTKKKIDLKTNTKNLSEWDSLGHLTILTSLDKKFKNKTSKLKKLATANTVKEIVLILKKAKLLK